MRAALGLPARQKAKNVSFSFLHFSNTSVSEKWRCIHAPQGTSD
jgi:hypothetical protein